MIITLKSYKMKVSLTQLGVNDDNLIPKVTKREDQ